MNHLDHRTTGDHEITGPQRPSSSRFSLSVDNYLLCVEEASRVRAGRSETGELEELTEADGLVSDCYFAR
jgi:hypothetical protein